MSIKQYSAIYLRQCLLRAVLIDPQTPVERRNYSRVGRVDGARPIARRVSAGEALSGGRR